MLYAEGLGVHRDYSGVANWFREAVEHGSPAAQDNLSLLYGRGHGVEQDFVQAYIWASIAVRSGRKDAVPDRGAFRASFSDDQLRIAERRESFLYLKIQQDKSSQ